KPTAATASSHQDSRMSAVCRAEKRPFEAPSRRFRTASFWREIILLLVVSLAIHYSAVAASVPPLGVAVNPPPIGYNRPPFPTRGRPSPRTFPLAARASSSSARGPRATPRQYTLHVRT